MKLNSLSRLLPIDNFDPDLQRCLPFQDLAGPSRPAMPIKTVHELDVYDRHGRGYELVVHQDPRTRCVLTYCLRYRPTH